jgi:hypothetical protein
MTAVYQYILQVPKTTDITHTLRECMKQAIHTLTFKNYHELDMIVGKYLFVKYGIAPKRDDFIKHIFTPDEFDMILSFLRYSKIDDYTYTANSLFICDKEKDQKVISRLLDRIELIIKNAKENNHILIYFTNTRYTLRIPAYRRI